MGPGRRPDSTHTASAGRSRVPILLTYLGRESVTLPLYIWGKQSRPRVLPPPLPFSSSGSAAASSSLTSPLGSRKRNPKKV
ncbi:hypothetical protein ZWY2020_018952 [Hordeum vulgare]|nr:hypothetical protein ZWY2020_018952 [Hordeum vulgare]